MTIKALIDYPEAGSVAIPRCVCAFQLSTAAPSILSGFGIVVASLVKNGVGDCTVALNAGETNGSAFFAVGPVAEHFVVCLKPSGTTIQVQLTDKGGIATDGSVYVSLWKYP